MACWVPLYADSQKGLPVLETTDFELLGTDGGSLHLTVKAHKMCQYENGNATLAGGITIVLYENKEDNPTNIQADTLSYNKAEDLCVLAGNVLLSKPQQQLSIRTEHLSYDIKKEIISTALSIVIVDKENILKGSGLRATKDLTKYTITNPSGAVEVEQASQF
ncbi:MAG: LPS export ABC transporter periplasmic protein LptC [Candidatus Cardinium sp.]|uniref:LPS export ABC transporter periplasmic protein LptC n=1 Tax=Cardinium endosymbiont of Dermatophagoides farinae TaxID=2597823 RepID=UPI001642D7AA|nr:LPS export ABC transporter periplasmic protein LptC [Cardinium endosymbiont of Dermatophagoides farinae]UWW97298.1 MAG: LPS export ABC transporter periplasmic protein LptC [Candidatus Cardinium sp.]